MSRRTWAEIAGLSFEDLKALASSCSDPASGDAYGEAVDAMMALELYHVEKLVKERQAAKAKVAEEEQTARRGRRHDAQRRRLREGAAFFPRWWIYSGLWGKLGAAGFRAAPVIASLIDPVRNFEPIKYALIAEIAGCSEDTAERGANEAVALGLLARSTRKVPGTNPPRSSCFYSLPAALPVTGAQECGV